MSDLLGKLRSRASSREKFKKCKEHIVEHAAQGRSFLMILKTWPMTAKYAKYFQTVALW
jgi:hypothetical protein